MTSAEPLHPLAGEFLKQGVFVETKVLANLDKGVSVLVQGAGAAG